MAELKFQKILLMARPGVPGVSETLQAVRDYLLAKNVEIAVEETSAFMLADRPINIIKNHNLISQYELIIVIGGDGSLLHAAHLALPYNIPVLGINRGRLGFLTDIHPDQLNKIGEVLNGYYQEEQRFLLQVQLFSHHHVSHTGMALNDVVLLPGDMPQMIEYEIYINQQFVCSQRADGLIVATPTGSTAYALSGGGPILHPHLNAVVLVPMFPHTLSSRPIVIDANSHIEVAISKSIEFSPHISCDGHSRITIAPGQRCCIEKHPQLLRLIHPNDYNYFTTLREKLGWEQHITTRKKK